MILYTRGKSTTEHRQYPFNQTLLSFLLLLPTSVCIVKYFTRSVQKLDPDLFSESSINHQGKYLPRIGRQSTIRLPILGLYQIVSKCLRETFTCSMPRSLLSLVLLSVTCAGSSHYLLSLRAYGALQAPYIVFAVISYKLERLRCQRKTRSPLGDRAIGGNIQANEQGKKQRGT